MRIAADDQPAGANPVERPITDSERDHWAYRPLADVEAPAVDDPLWSRNPIDRFLKAEMVRQSVSPLPPVSRATLLRRLSFDLTGLPPTSQEVLEFLADQSPEAYERVVDRLLASPAYGERWAQHWLDLARFAETDGFEFDAVRPNAWRYRDWVIAALNQDVPFDEFLRMQLAGDELSEAPEAAVATGFLLCGPDMPDLNLQDERRHQVLNEMAATVGSAFLGLQFGCAQCHDHKYDPITQYDFYRLRAFFESAELFRDHPIPTAEEAASRRRRKRRGPPRTMRMKSVAASWKRPAASDSATRILTSAPPRAGPGRIERRRAQEHATVLEQLRPLPRLPELPLGRVMRDGAADELPFCRGDFRQPGPTVSPGFPRLLASSDDNDVACDKPRTELARWLVGSCRRLTAHVIVNRVWQWHFGVGLSEAASDFGVMGSEPIHPQLLDWLASIHERRLEHQDAAPPDRHLGGLSDGQRPVRLRLDRRRNEGGRDNLAGFDGEGPGEPATMAAASPSLGRGDVARRDAGFEWTLVVAPRRAGRAAAAGTGSDRDVAQGSMERERRRRGSSSAEHLFICAANIALPAVRRVRSPGYERQLSYATRIDDGHAVSGIVEFAIQPGIGQASRGIAGCL